MKPAIFLEPRGFIKILELIFSICAFSVLVGYYSEIKYVVDCSSGVTTAPPTTTTTTATTTTTTTTTTTPTTTTKAPLGILLESLAGSSELNPNPPQLTLGQIPILGPSNTTKHSAIIPVNYPFKFGVNLLEACNGSSLSISLDDKSSSEAIFFVLVGVTAFLYALAMIPFYLFLEDLFPNAQMVFAVDFFIHILWVIFWFSAAIAWTAGVTNLKAETSEEHIREQNDAKFGCGTGTIGCTVYPPSDYAGAIVAVIFGYVNLILFSGNAWFVFKETNFHS